MNPKTINRIAEKGLKGIMAEEYSEEQRLVISTKVSHLLSYLSTITTWDSLNRFTREFNERTRFREIDFDSFFEEFEQRFGQDIKAYMDEWYTSSAGFPVNDKRSVPENDRKDTSHRLYGKQFQRNGRYRLDH